MRIRRAGDAALIAEFSQTLDPAAAARARALELALLADPPPGLIETMPALRSLLVRFDPLRLSGRALAARLAALAQDLPEAPAPAARRWRIPICYEAPFALDLAEVATRTGLSEEEVIARHLGSDFTVLMVGSYPGHPYLGGLDPALALPRRAPPRTRLPAGSVGIAETMSNIYPQEAPGGWNILGRTPIPLFDAGWESPALLAAGDRVRFVRITAEAFAEIAGRPFRAEEWAA
ncbi:MAG: 5-oxoprolinase subunit PxpB [Rhodovarius sp.]|nr:5-oxoprolinase subunit PxpB [Rhodovarius sp.]MCX7932632.1 5-oxoprolinase subunit PxpB [Rhodovarius sp.]MDW8314555.1 5-oxoprolinase subunit PxpB [Rhodovarius sp.]